MMWNTTADQDGDLAIFEADTKKLVGVAATVNQALDICISHNAQEAGLRLAQSQMREFMRLCGQDTPDKPTLPNPEVQALRLKLHEEEAIVEMWTAFATGDLVELADAIGDALYVVLGTAVACGIEIEPIFNEIHRSNMTKFIDGYRRDDGKWIKGPSYEPANLQPIIDAQSATA